MLSGEVGDSVLVVDVFEDVFVVAVPEDSVVVVAVTEKVAVLLDMVENEVVVLEDSVHAEQTAGCSFNRLHLGRDHVDIDGGGLNVHPVAALHASSMA